MTIREYMQKYPQKTMTLSSDKDFKYRYYNNPDAKETIVLLTGGIGLSDLFYLHFEAFSKIFSVMTFDYQLEFENNAEFASAVAELLERLGIKAWLVGQSLGGIVAQIIAKNHPQTVSGLVLSNTCSLSAEMSDKAYSHTFKMVKSAKKTSKLLPVVPFGLYKKSMKKFILKKKCEGFSSAEKEVIENLCDIMAENLTKPYTKHMMDFLADAENHFGMNKKDFSYLDDRALLILSDDDETFNQPSKDALISIMTNPTVVRDLTGGHLALLVRLDKYIDIVTDYILRRS